MEQEEQAEPRIYEIGYHILPLVPEEKLAEKVGELKAILEKHSAVTISEELPKSRPLSYPVRKFVEGRYQDFKTAYFGWVKFETDADKIASIEESLKALEDILRFIVVKTVRESTLAPLKVFQPKEVKFASKSDEKKDAEKAPISEAELDKTIDELVVE